MLLNLKGDTKESRVQHFKSFLAQGKQYLDLTSNTKNKILLVESFPFMPSNSNDFSEWKTQWKQGVVSALKDVIVNPVISPLILVFHTDAFLSFQRFVGSELVSKMSTIQ
jgi:hypothetical protein